MAELIGQDPCCNVVSFSIDAKEDKDGGTELFVRAKGAWFYVSIKPTDLSLPPKAASKSKLCEKYEELRAEATKAQTKREAEMMGQAHDEILSKQETEVANKKRKMNKSSDSGYHSNEERKDPQASKDQGQTEENEDAEMALQNWMLAPLAPHIAHLTLPDDVQPGRPHTLEEWYKAPIHFFRLRAANNSSLEAVPRSDLDSKAFFKHNLQHTLTIPKQLRNAAPWYSSADLLVISEVNDIHMPIHPTLVRVSPSEPKASEKCTDAKSSQPTHFLKLVPYGPGARHSILREIGCLQNLQKLKTDHPETTQTLRFPQLQGLVAPPSTPTSHATILGFLLELIPSPTPLNHKFSTEIPRAKREKWAREAEEMVETLRAHGVTWGDAKAD